MVVMNQVKSSIKEGIYKKIVLKIKGPYRVLEKATLRSYFLHSFYFCGVLERPRIKVEESAASM